MAPRSLTCNKRWSGKPWAATRKSSWSMMYCWSSLGLSGYHSRWAPPGSSDSPVRDPSFCEEPQHHHSAQLLLSCKASERLLTPANVVCHFLRHTDLHCSRSDWHRDRSLRVASQSLAMVDFRRLHGSNPHDFSSLKLHLGMGEDFSANQLSKLQKNFWRRPSLFRLGRQSKWENDWADLEAERTCIRG